MKNLDKMFKSDPALAIKYKEDIRDYTEKRQGRKWTPKEAQKVAPVTSYVPRYAAWNINETNEIRVIDLAVEVAVEYQDSSKNKHLLKGPDLLSKLLIYYCVSEMKNLVQWWISNKCSTKY